MDWMRGLVDIVAGAAQSDGQRVAKGVEEMARESSVGECVCVCVGVCLGAGGGDFLVTRASRRESGVCVCVGGGGGWAGP